ncbi:MAG: hypothetical protein GAK28_00770 [Luteibacter sp.]|uniref:hypothetical protein n=1 Tax=Luteibacter sp. TaxID=1886636 RepID=UPI00137E7824|nr:hypothetical protein [Luteibacter sp.]KAF1009137.1 MAG: hypothetical protein GAK28_00770 [Luteibacter sp.]
MSASWKTVYEGQHEGRSITVRESGDGTFKVLTQQNVHDEGIAYQDGKTFVHVSPSSVGEQVESEVTSRDALREALKELHFSSATVSAIVDHLH